MQLMNFVPVEGVWNGRVRRCVLVMLQSGDVVVDVGIAVVGMEMCGMVLWCIVDASVGVRWGAERVRTGACEAVQVRNEYVRGVVKGVLFGGGDVGTGVV